MGTTSVAYQYQAVLLTNKDSAPAKDWVVDVGFKPDVIWATILSSTTGAADRFVKVNGGDATEDEEVIQYPGHQGGGNAATTAASVQLDNALSFTDRGFRIERSTSFFRVNDLQMLFECFRSGGRGLLVADLEDEDYDEKIEAKFGSGTQFDYEAPDPDKLDWIVREA